MKIKWILLVFLFFFVMFPQVTAQGALEESYETPEGHFTIYYTDDFANQPKNAVTSLQIADFGAILEDIRTKSLGYGFNDPGGPKPVKIYYQLMNAHGGCGGMDFDPWSLGNTWPGYGPSVTEPYLSASHEYLHVIQFCYDLDHYGDKWITEGQARSLQDKLYPALDKESGADVASYLGQVNGYLGNPDRTLMELSYDAALWWTYVVENYGTINTEPDYGLDAFVEWWEAAETIGTVADPIKVFNEMLSRLGHNTVTFEEVFKDYVVSLYAKDLSGPNVPGKYKYKDETQTPGPYRTVEPNINKTLLKGGTVAGTDFIDKWAPKYYIVRPGLDPDTNKREGLFNVEVKQITSDKLFYDLLVVKDNDIVEETRVTGTQFSRSIYAEADFLVLIVTGLENTPTDPAKYHWSFSSGTGLAVNIQLPLNMDGLRARAGNFADPEKFLSIVEVLASGNPVQGLTHSDFQVSVGGSNATVVSSAYVNGLYFLEIQAPPQFSAGKAQLVLTLSDVKFFSPDSVEYGDLAIDTSVVMDKSASMSWDEKIDAAQAAARLYVNSLLLNDLLSLVQFETDALLLEGLDKVSSIRNTVLNQIDLINADGPATSIGDGIFVAQNELFTNGNASHENHIILLTDGQENEPRLIGNVKNLLYTSPNNTRLHVILVGIDSEALILQDVALKSGGTVHFAFDPSSGTLASDLAKIYRSIIERQNKEQRVFSKTGLKSGTWSIAEPFDLDQAKSATVVFNYNATTSLTSGYLKLEFPNGTQIAPTYFRQKSSTSSNYYGHYVFKLNNPPAGHYELVSTSSKSGTIEYFAEAAVRSPVSINMYFGLDELERFIGMEVPILVTLTDDKGPITHAEVIADVTTGTGYKNFQTWNLHLYDDGAHGDGFANDGVYGNYFTRTKDAGTYMVSVRAMGTSTTYGDFTREISESFHLYDNYEQDPDGDGLPTLWETRHGLDPYSDVGNNGKNGDPDMDGLLNSDELQYGTSPNNPDTDGGGESDASEVIWSRDPYYPDDDGFVPPKLQAEPENQKVILIFSVEPPYGYLKLYRSEINSTTGFVLVTSGISPTGEYNDTGLMNNKTYWYKMVAVSPVGEESGFSSVVSATPRPDNEPPFGFVTINKGARVTNTTNVNLTLFADADVAEMRISLDPSFDGVVWVPFGNFSTFILDGTGLQYVYVQFRDTVGNIGGGEHGGGSYFYDGIIVNTSSIITVSPITSTSTTTVPTSWNIMFSVSALIAVTIIVIINRRRIWKDT